MPTWTPSHLPQRTLVPVPSGSRCREVCERPRVTSDSESMITTPTACRPGFQTTPWKGSDAPHLSKPKLSPYPSLGLPDSPGGAPARVAINVPSLIHSINTL